MAVQVGKLQRDINIMRYKVKTLSGAIEFNPIDLDIVVRDKFTKTIIVDSVPQDVEMIAVDSILVQKHYVEDKEVGHTTQVKYHEFPFSYWSGMIDGYNPEIKQPILNEDKLNAILSQFNLKLAE